MNDCSFDVHQDVDVVFDENGIPCFDTGSGYLYPYFIPPFDFD